MNAPPDQARFAQRRAVAAPPRDAAGEEVEAWPPYGERRFGAVNWIGLGALCRREVRRFLSVAGQTVFAPVATAALFLAVFTLAFGARRAGAADDPFAGVDFATFLAPGVVMMTVLQNAFANTSSSIMVAKAQGNIIDTLTPPLSPHELVFGFAVGAVARGALLAGICAMFLFPIVDVRLEHPLWSIAFTLLGSLMLGLLGLIAGVWAIKFDHMAAVTNFVVTPLAFLSGAFYSIAILPEPWWTLSHLNPFFFLIDGFRYGAIGRSDVSPELSLLIALAAIAALWAVCARVLRTGYRLKS